MPWFRKKPLEVEAVQFTGANIGDIVQFAGLSARAIGRSTSLYILSPNGLIRAAPGDWIIRDIYGVFSLCKAANFEAIYEPMEHV